MSKLSVNAQLLRDMIRARVQLHAIELRVFRRDVLPILRAMEGEIASALNAAKDGTKPLGQYRAAQYQELRAEIAAIIANTAKEAPNALVDALGDVASREVRLMRGSMIRAAPELKAVLGSGLSTDQFAAVTQTATKDVLRGFEGWGQSRIGLAHDELKKSVGLGEDMTQAARRIQTIMPATRKQALNIARTGIQRAATIAGDEFRSDPKNRRLSKGVQWLATLDVRTCVVCGANDGKWWSYEREDGAAGLYSERPEMPAHPGCRCAWVDVLKSPDEIGLPGIIWSDATRVSMDGDVPEGTTFADWFDDRPAGQQKAILGPAKYALWKSGELDLDDFSVAGRARTVAELGNIV